MPIWKVLVHQALNMTFFQLKEDPSFKPSGGRLGENDMDYDTDDKTMAALRRQLRKAREEYYRYKRFGSFMFRFFLYMYLHYNSICNGLIQFLL